MSDRLFSVDEIPEVPLFREPRRARGAQVMDERLDNDYPPEWNKCTTCGGGGKVEAELPDPWPSGGVKLWIDGMYRVPCPDCLGMGSLKARVRLEAGHRCVRCKHPFVTKGDAKMLHALKKAEILATFDPDGENAELQEALDGVDPVAPSPGRWSPCDARCDHRGPFRIVTSSPSGETVIEPQRGEYWSLDYGPGKVEFAADHVHADEILGVPGVVELLAEWRVLTVHHLDGDKANLRWWNLCALCQRCHLQIQGKVVMERVYPHEHSEWFKPHAAGYYAFVYLCRVCGRDLSKPINPRRTDDHPPHMCEPGLDLSREQVMERLDELLALELVSA